MTKKKINYFKFIIILFLIIFLNNVRFTNASSEYSIALEKGTQVYEVTQYDETIWKQLVNTTSNPKDWFGGDANLIGSKCKTTIFMMWKTVKLTYVLMRELIIPENLLPTFSIIENYGYNSTYLLNHYPGFQNVSGIHSYVWPFRLNGEFDYNNFPYSELHILQNPDLYTKLLSDYNNFSAVINNDSLLQSLGYSLPFLTGDEVLWNFILERFPLATPINSYLNTMVDALGCRNVTIQDNKLIIQRMGNTNYIAEIAYNYQGNLESFHLKSSEGYVFYKITSYYPKLVVLIIVIICSICVLTLIVYNFYRKRRRV